MTANLVVLSQSGVTRKDGSTFTNPLTVTIMSYPNDKYNLTKNLIKIPVPKSTKAQEGDTTSGDYGANATKFVDILNKVEERITINGSLVNGTISGDSSTTALNRKKDLIKIATGGGVFNMTYESETFTVNCDGLEIRNVSGTTSATDIDVAQYDVTFTAIKGVNL